MNTWDLLVNIAGVLSTPVLAISYVPQIISLYKNKNADGISLSFWFILDTSLTMLFILALEVYFTTSQASLSISQGVNLLFALVVTAQVIYYKRKARIQLVRHSK